MKHVEAVVNALVHNDARRATKYAGPHSIVRATRRLFHGRIRHNDDIEITLTIGRPNSLEKKFIKKCVKAGEPFPVKKIRLQFPRKAK